VGVTLREVAAHAGVSTRTVSNVVHDYPHVSATMRAKVQASLEALNYQPNLLARSLRQGRTGIITCSFPTSSLRTSASSRTRWSSRQPRSATP